MCLSGIKRSEMSMCIHPVMPTQTPQHVCAHKQTCTLQAVLSVWHINAPTLHLTRYYCATVAIVTGLQKIELCMCVCARTRVCVLSHFTLSQIGPSVDLRGFHQRFATTPVCVGLVCVSRCAGMKKQRKHLSSSVGTPTRNRSYEHLLIR